MTLNYVKIVKMYHLFRNSVRHGDAVMMEVIYRDILPIFHVCGKHHYFEIVLSMMDNFYGTLPYKLLQLMRINRTVPLYDGTDKDNQQMANWALDAVILETTMKFTHTVKFANNVKGFAETSQNLVFQNKADRLKSSEYCRVKSSKANEERYVGHVEILNVGIQGKNMKATATPFLSRMDPVAPHSILSDWNPDQTLVIGIVLDGDNGEGDEIMHLTHVAKKWISQENHASEERMWGKHILFIPASEYLHRTYTLTKPECSFLLPEYASIQLIIH